jgi:hypothetical protein
LPWLASRFLWRVRPSWQGRPFFPDFPFFGATWALRVPPLAFLLAFGSATASAGAVSVCSVMVIMSSPMAVITVTTSITLVRSKGKRNLR